MSFFAFGVNHKTCPVEVREKLHFKADQISALLRGLKPADTGILELAIVSTCNRVEFYGYCEDPVFPEERLIKLIEQPHAIRREEYYPYLYRYEGKDVLRHLFRVAAGLDSLVVGENEILGQIRDAFHLANQAGAVHALLHRLFEKALKVGKTVRTETKINEGAVSIPSVAVELAEKIFGNLTDEKVAVIGTGEMSQLTLKNLKNSGAQIAMVVSRSEEKGKLLAAEYQARYVSYDAWVKHLDQIDILIASTASSQPIVKFNEIKTAMSSRRKKPLFIIDIAVPRNVEAQVHSIDDVYVYNIDDLENVSQSNLKRRHKEIHAAEEWVEKAVLEYQGWMEQLKARPVMERFEKFLNEVLEMELKRVPSLTQNHRDELKHRIRSKLLHPPFEKIKEASQNGGVTRYLEALHSLFDLKEREERGSK